LYKGLELNEYLVKAKQQRRKWLLLCGQQRNWRRAWARDHWQAAAAQVARAVGAAAGLGPGTLVSSSGAGGSWSKKLNRSHTHTLTENNTPDNDTCCGGSSAKGDGRRAWRWHL